MAEFDTEENAKKGFEEFKKYIALQQKAYDFWQANREKGTECLNEMKKQFNGIFKWIGNIDSVDNACNQFSSHLLDSSDTHNLECAGCMIKFSATVWHMDDWQHLIKFIKSLKGCKKAVYASDEYENISEWKDKDGSIIFGGMNEP